MNGRWRVAAVMGCMWVASLLYGEVFIYWLPVWTCPWPSLNANQVQDSPKSPIRVLVIADPQITDRTSYGMKPGSLALWLTQFYSDIYMRRAFRTSVLGLEPEQIVFLGDLFDGGPFLSPKEWQESLERFRHIFDQSQGAIKDRGRKEIPMHTLPGNHDLGYEAVQTQIPEVVAHYKQVFGGLDYRIKIGGVEFVFVDAQVLDAAVADVANSSWSFIQEISKEKNPLPRVLVTHIPLYRPDDTPCGANRASPVINQVPELLDRVIIYKDSRCHKTCSGQVMVLSGHDHDQCYHVHETTQGSFPEYTVGSFSWQQGNLYPSMMLLSIARDAQNSPSPEAVVASHLCFLPVQIAVYIWYGVLLIITILAIVLWPARGLLLNSTQKFIAMLMNIRSSSGLKAKDEDAEWEMVWDAEGGMHLINKGPKTPAVPIGSSKTSAKRGTVARRTGHELHVDTILKLPMDTNRLSPSPSTILRSVSRKAHPLSVKIIQILAPILSLAGLNISLYVMLLMIDWTTL
ncbi:hypothetical protein BDL97_08G009700 [Sphagnum fallax]|nr:hypothetical protein BDL97_08G009700 [Sphagnum fallax]